MHPQPSKESQPSLATGGLIFGDGTFALFRQLTAGGHLIVGNSSSRQQGTFARGIGQCRGRGRGGCSLVVVVAHI